MPKHEQEVLAAIEHRNPLVRQVVLSEEFYGGQHLCCPRCGGHFLHSDYSHSSRDSKESSIRILFSCECCGPAAEFEMVITDYKGNVFVEWREP